MRPIDADVLKEEFTCKGDEWINNIIDSEPTIDADRPQGEWIPYEASLNFGDGEGCVIEHKCSACGYLWGEPDYKFCPNCGADMRKGADDE